ncbi:MAG: hypothetical protein A2Y74_05670 [Actinobacteria bacterium RBG_13_63_9]|nr:MAG: hypothetical protein A2Y74_05670 [Actinobacteria bacterium RBG_13_63_9]
MATSGTNVVARIASFTNGATYKICRGRDGHQYCSCPAWRFSKGEKTCKHIRLFRETPRWQRAA